MNSVAAVDKTDHRPEPACFSPIRTSLYDLMEAVMDELLPHEEQHAALIVNRLLITFRVRAGVQ
jgi:hypothetical protein